MLLMPHEVDDLFRYPSGKSERLAKRGQIPCIRLPDGSIRFDRAQIEKLLSGDCDHSVNREREVVHA